MECYHCKQRVGRVYDAVLWKDGKPVDSVKVCNDCRVAFRESQKPNRVKPIEAPAVVEAPED